MIAPLILLCVAIYMMVGWIFIGVLDRRIGRARSGGVVWVALLLWPITVVVDLLRHGPNH